MLKRLLGEVEIALDLKSEAPSSDSSVYQLFDWTSHWASQENNNKQQEQQQQNPRKDRGHFTEPFKGSRQKVFCEPLGMSPVWATFIYEQQFLNIYQSAPFTLGTLPKV